MKHFFTLIFSLVVVSAMAGPLHENTRRGAKASTEIFDGPIPVEVASSDAIMLHTLATEVDDADYTDWNYVDHASIFDELFLNLKNHGLAKGDNHFAVYVRYNTSDNNLYDLKLENFLGICDLVLNCDRRTCRFTAQPAVTDIPVEDGIYSEYGDFTYYDYHRFVVHDRYGQNNVSLEGGKIMLGQFQWCAETSNVYGTWVYLTLITFDHAPQWSYQVDSKQVLLSNEEDAVVTITHTGAAEKFKYNIRKVYSQDDMDESFRLLYGEKDGDAQITDGEIRFKADDGAKLYIVAIAALDKDGNYLGICDDLRYWDTHRIVYIAHNVADTHEWVDYCDGQFHPGNMYWLYCDYNVRNGITNMAYKRRLETRKDAYGKIFRVVNPAGVDTPFGQLIVNTEGAQLYDDEDFYIVLDMTDENDTSTSMINVVGATTLMYDYKDDVNPLVNIVFENQYSILHNRIIDNSNKACVLELGNVIELVDKSIDDEGRMYVKAAPSVAKLRYVVEPIDGNAAVNALELVEKITNGDESLEIFETGSYTTDLNLRSTNDRIFAISIPDNIWLNGSYRIIAVPYDDLGNALDYYLDESIINEWINIGKAKLSSSDNTYFGTYGFKEECDVEKYGLTDKYRLVEPSVNNGFREYMNETYGYYDAFFSANSTYLPIDATDKSNAFIDGCFETGYVDSNGMWYLTSVAYLMKTGYIQPMDFQDGTMVDNVITLNKCAVRVKEYKWGGNISYDNLVVTLPVGNVESSVDKVTVDNCEEESMSQPIEYYNLQGIRVANPTRSGIYLRRQGSKVTKIIM